VNKVVSRLDPLRPLSPTSIVDPSDTITVPCLSQRRVNDSRSHTGTAARDDGLLRIDTTLLEDLPQLLRRQESLGLRVQEFWHGYWLGGWDVPARKARARLWVDALPSAFRPRVENLHFLAALFVVVEREFSHFLEVNYFASVQLRQWVLGPLYRSLLPLFNLKPLLYLKLVVVQQVHCWMSKYTQRPRNTRCGKDP